MDNENQPNVLLNQTESLIPPIASPQVVSPSVASSSASKPMVWPLIGLMLVAVSISLLVGIFIGKNQSEKNPLLTNTLTTSPTQIANSPSNFPKTLPSVASPSSEPTGVWKIYNSPEIGDYVSPFQLSYPTTWKISQKLTAEEPRSLTLTLTNSDQETITISQGMGGGGSCIYFDDPDYLSFEGMGKFFSTYEQLTKPAQWRISQPKDKNETTQIVCESTKERYLDSTRIGSINLKLKTKASVLEAKTILEKIVFKPSPKTKTLFD